MTGFWICLSLNKYSLTYRVTSCYVLYDTYSEPCLLSTIQTYSGIITSYSDIFSHIVAYLEPCVALEYSEPCHIQNPGIFRIHDMFKNSVKAYSGIFRMLCNTRMLRTLSYSEHCRIQNFGIFKTWDIFRVLFI